MFDKHTHAAKMRFCIFSGDTLCGEIHNITDHFSQAVRWVTSLTLRLVKSLTCDGMISQAASPGDGWQTAEIKNPRLAWILEKVQEQGVSVHALPSTAPGRRGDWRIPIHYRTTPEF